MAPRTGRGGSIISPLDLVRAERLAIVWTRGRACRTRGWQHTLPFFERETHPEAIWGAMRADGYEPGCTLRTSRLVGIEADGPNDAAIVKAIMAEVGAVPLWIEARPDRLGRAHLYFRRPRELTEDEKVSFRVEGGVVTAARNNYYRCVGGNDYRLHRTTLTRRRSPTISTGGWSNGRRATPRAR